jgi:hypothetical protein
MTRIELRLQHQLYRHDPAAGVFGDCFRTCVACLLGLPAGNVPHFNDRLASDATPAEVYRATKAADDWLGARGLRLVRVGYCGDLDSVLDCLAKSNPGLPCILSGTSRNGVGHCVVVLDGAIVCDPSLDQSGIVGPLADGVFNIEYLGVDIAVPAPLGLAEPLTHHNSMLSWHKKSYATQSGEQIER